MEGVAKFGSEHVDLGRPVKGNGTSLNMHARVLTVALLALTALMPPAALAGEPTAEATLPVVSGSYIPTDGMLTSREARHLKRIAAARRARAQEAADTSSSGTSSVWLFDYIGRMFNDEPTVARRPRTATRIAARPAAVKVAVAKPLPLVPQDATPADFATATKPVPAIPAVNPIVTGALVTPRPAPPASSMPSPEPESVIIAAERSQARLDLVKLEFASRTYDERKLSGQQVFDLRNDWRVLERARDALAGAELASAVAAGFEANAYINEATRTIVVAVAGSQDLRRDFLTADVWKALIKAEAPQQFYLAKTYVRSVIQRYQLQGYSTECIGHSLGGGACAYVASELGIRALLLNPISAGKLGTGARFLVTNYIVDGDIANLVYTARGNEFPGNVQIINDGRDVIRLMALEKYGQLAGPVLVIRELRAGIKSHKVDTALDLIAAQAETPRPR